MDIQNALWKLHGLADCSLLEQSSREAAKLAADVLNNVRNITNLGSAEELTTITAAVHQLAAADALKVLQDRADKAESALKSLHAAVSCDEWGALPIELRKQVNAIVQE